MVFRYFDSPQIGPDQKPLSDGPRSVCQALPIPKGTGRVPGSALRGEKKQRKGNKLYICEGKILALSFPSASLDPNTEEIVFFFFWMTGCPGKLARP